MVPTEGSRNNPRYYTLDRQKPDWGCDESTRISYIHSHIYCPSTEHARGKAAVDDHATTVSAVRYEGLDAFRFFFKK